jgi:hypothetical protein
MSMIPNIKILTWCKERTDEDALNARWFTYCILDKGKGKMRYRDEIRGRDKERQQIQDRRLKRM